MKYDLRLIREVRELVKTNVVDFIVSADDGYFKLYLFKKIKK